MPQTAALPLRIAPRRPLSTEAYERLRRSIAAGALVPGAKLVEAELAASLGISRTPLREAFRRLEAEGFLGRAAGSGLQVLGLRPDEVEEIFGIRAVLEGFAARLAARRASAADLARLATLLLRAHRFLERGARDRLLELNTRFHDGINALSGSPRLQALLSGLHDRILLYRRITLDVPGERRRGWEEHRAILQALQARDGRAAERLVVRHVTRKKWAVLAALRGDGGAVGDAPLPQAGGQRRAAAARRPGKTP